MNKKYDFWAMFGDVREFCKFKKYIDSRNPNYNEKSTILDRSRVQPKQRDVALRVARLIFLIIFVTSCYVLNKIVILSEISIPEWSETGPGPRGIVVMTRRAYCLSSVRVIRWQGRASSRYPPCAPRAPKMIIFINFRPCFETSVRSVSSLMTSTTKLETIMKNLQF